MPVMSITWLVLFLFFMVLGVPLSVSMGLGALTAMAFVGKFSLLLVPLTMFNSMNSFLLLAVPFFTLTGQILLEGGASKRIFDFAGTLVGWMRGGLGSVNVVSGMIFGGISGSSVADVCCLGPIQMDAMSRRGYPLAYSAAITVASATLAVVIPPSVIMVIYAIAASESVVKCLIAGLVPGIVVGLGLIVVNWATAKRRHWANEQAFSLRACVTQFGKSFWALLTPVVLLAGMVSGIFTPTEASAIAAVYALLITWLVYGEFTLDKLRPIMVGTVRYTGTTLLLVGTGMVGSYILSVERIPLIVSEYLTQVTHSRVVFLILLNVIFLIVGCLMEAIVAILVMTPILMPVVKGFGIDPVHFGVIMIANLAIGLITPPVGICLFAISSVSKIPVEAVLKEVWPFLLMMIATLAVITFVPGISLFLPNLLVR